MSRLFGAYKFMSKDPAIDAFKTVVQDRYGKVTRKALKEIDAGGGPRVGTMNAWFYGKTKRPQNCTIEAAIRAMGYRRKIVKWNGGPE
jgi:hypothetical protein